MLSENEKSLKEDAACESRECLAHTKNVFMKFYLKIWWFSFECFLPFKQLFSTKRLVAHLFLLQKPSLIHSLLRDSCLISTSIRVHNMELSSCDASTYFNNVKFSLSQARHTSHLKRASMPSFVKISFADNAYAPQELLSWAAYHRQDTKKNTFQCEPGRHPLKKGD